MPSILKRYRCRPEVARTFAQSKCNVLDPFNGIDNVSIICGDNFKTVIELPVASFDICLTSPPYWDIFNMRRTADIKNNNNHSNKEEDIGNIVNYNGFIRRLASLFVQIRTVLKPNAYCIMNVMDIRKKVISTRSIAILLRHCKM
jgi:DNA modification methylase